MILGVTSNLIKNVSIYFQRLRLYAKSPFGEKSINNHVQQLLPVLKFKN